jgi:phosphate transport system permease protein
MIGLYALAILLIAFTAFSLGKTRANGFMDAGNRIHSLPNYHGLLSATFVIIPMVAIAILWSATAPRLVETQAIASLSADLQPGDVFERSGRLREIMAAYNGAEAVEGIRAAAETYASALTLSHIALFALGLGLAGLALRFALKRMTPDLRARNTFEKVVIWVLIACSAVAVITTIGILFSVLFETLRFFARYSPIDFLFGTQWSPQTAIRADQVGQSGAFGFLPLFTGTMLITFIAMLVAGPVGLFAAIYMAEYATPRVRATVKPLLEILAGVPTVVFGFFAAITVAPLVRHWGEGLGLNVASESALAAGFVMGVMIIPFVSSLSDDVINAVPQTLRDGSYAMGATRSETIKKVVLPAALPGIVSAFMLAISRAIGETMIVVMAAGLTANLTLNPLEAVTTITVQIKTLLTGDQEFDSTKTLSAFALGFVLFFFTLMLNFIALKIVRKYREQYD